MDYLLSLPQWRVALRVLPFGAVGLGATDAFTVSVLNDEESAVFVDATAVAYSSTAPRTSRRTGARSMRRRRPT